MRPLYAGLLMLTFVPGLRADDPLAYVPSSASVHLDEPLDSEHNKSLVARMPPSTSPPAPRQMATRTSASSTATG